MVILDGKAVAARIYADLAARAAVHIASRKRPPHLVIVLVGEDAASKIYVRAKIKIAEKIAFRTELITLPATATHHDLASVMKNTADKEDVDGMILQFPLPPHLMADKDMFVQLIPAEKDVDGFHFNNIGSIFTDLPAPIAATPYGIVLLLEAYGISLESKHVVVVGRSHIVGKPLALLLTSKNPWGNATVTLCHSKTKGLSFFTRNADVVVVCVGQAHFLKKEMVKQGVIVIDVGINRIFAPDTKKGYIILGDTCMEDLQSVVSYITPVPGGVGPMTIAALMKNTLAAYERKFSVFPITGF